MKWRHIMDERPQHNQYILKAEPWGDTLEWVISLREWEINEHWEKYLHECHQDGWEPNYWWMPSSEFTFPCTFPSAESVDKK